MTKYFLFKELAPREDPTPYSIFSWNGEWKFLHAFENEDDARAAHSRYTYGEE